MDAGNETTTPEEDAYAEGLMAKLNTPDETLSETVWLLRYTTRKHGIRLPTHGELMRERHGDEGGA